ncbi:MAG TPA: glycosyltransferase family 2 protein [Gemmataceae bacterium]|jgi:dolichol-phosphate mannosyltransferase
MSDRLPLLSVVSPAFNEEAGLPRFHAALAAALDLLAGECRVEIVYVDDGSRDGTLAVLRTLAGQDDRVRYLSFSRNFGNQAALTAGLESAVGDVIVTLDSDLQHPPDLIPQLVARWRDGFDVVLAVRAGVTDRTQGWFKRNASLLFHRLLRRCSELDVRLDASDYRLLSRRAVDGLLRLPESHRYLRGLVAWLGLATAEVPFETAPRIAGSSRYTLGRLVRLAFDGLLSFSRVPLRLAVGGGLAVVAVSFAISTALALSSPIEPATAALLVAVHVIGGIVLAAVGVLGAYTIRIFEECQGRPLYVLKEMSPVLPGRAKQKRVTSPLRRQAKSVA